MLNCSTPEQLNATIAISPAILTDVEFARLKEIRTLGGTDDFLGAPDEGLGNLGLIETDSSRPAGTIVRMTDLARDFFFRDAEFPTPTLEFFKLHGVVGDPFAEDPISAELCRRIIAAFDAEIRQGPTLTSASDHQSLYVAPALPASPDTIALPVSVGCAVADWSERDPEPFDYILLGADGAILAHVVSPEAAQRIMAALNQAASIETLCKRVEALFQDMRAFGLVEQEVEAMPQMQAVRRSMAALRGNGGDGGNGASAAGSEAAS